MVHFRRILVEKAGSAAVVKLLDVRLVEESIIRECGTELIYVVEGEKCNTLVIDFTNVEFVGNHFLNKLILLERVVKASGGRVVVFALTKEIAQIFTLTRLDKLFTIKPDRALALREFPSTV